MADELAENTPTLDARQITSWEQIDPLAAAVRALEVAERANLGNSFGQWCGRAARELRTAIQFVDLEWAMQELDGGRDSGGVGQAKADAFRAVDDGSANTLSSAV